MFGKKKKDTTPPALLANTDSAAVHTMQDDINALNGAPSTQTDAIPETSANPFSDTEQPTFAPSAQEPLAKEVVPNDLPAAAAINPAPSPTVDDLQKKAPEADNSPISSAPTKDLDTSNPFVDAPTPAPEPATTAASAAFSAAPEASPEQVTSKAQMLSQEDKTPQAPPAPQPEKTLATPPLPKDFPAKGPFADSSSGGTTANPFAQPPAQTKSPALEDEISKIQKEYGEVGNDDDLKKPRHGSFLSVFMIILVIAMIAGGGYYYWVMQSPDTDHSLVEIGKDTYDDLFNGGNADNDENDSETTNPNEYSETLPHYVVLETQSETALTDFESQMQTFSSNILTQQPVSAISFIVTDESGAPLAFDRFALITGMTLSPEVLAQIDEAFLLYGYYDMGTVRFGISASTLSPEAVTEAMKASEPTLVTSLTPLFAGVTPEVTNPTFNDGSYNAIPIRYANLNADQTLSVDYGTYSDNLVIGTSKETVRAIIDKL